jgi:structural maintenance of chromosome 2
MHLIRVIIEGFKSYGSRVTFDHMDTRFNAITGPNGSGKSNLFDSICFVLGITKMSQVRADNMDDLIYKHGGCTRATVTLVFDNSNPATSPPGWETKAQITVQRMIAKGGAGKYLIDGSKATVQRVHNLFHSVQLNVNNPTFLIQQGRIKEVAEQNTPKKTLAMLEEAAGTRMFDDKKDKAIADMRKQEGKLTETEAMLEKVHSHKEKLSGQRLQFEEYTEMKTEIEKKKVVLQAWEFHSHKLAQAKCTEEIRNGEEERKAMEQWMKDSTNVEAQLKRQLEETNAQKKSASGAALKAAEAEEKRCNEEYVKWNTECTQLGDSKEKEAKELAATKKTLDKLQQDKRKQEQAVDASTAAADEAAKAAEEEAARASAQEAQYEASMGLGSAPEDGAAGGKNLQAQLSDVNTEISALQTTLDTSKMRSEDKKKELKKVEEKLKKAQKEHGQADGQQSKLQAEINELQGQRSRLSYNEASEAELASEVERTKSELAGLSRREKQLGKEVSRFDFKYEDPEPNFDRRRVTGTVASNFTVRNPRDSTAIEALAGGRLHQVIVDSDKTSLSLFKNGRLARRVTFIPLNVIDPRVMANGDVTKAQKLAKDIKAGNVELAVKLLDFEPGLRRAMDYVFANTLVCETKEAARAICEQLRLRTVSIEGDSFDPSGMLTGGFRASSDLLNRLGEVKSLRAQMATCEERLASCQARLSACRADYEAFSKLQSDIDCKEHALHEHKETMRSSPVGLLVESRDTLTAAIEEAATVISSAKEELKTLEKSKGELEKQVSAFEGNREGAMKQAKKEMEAAKKKAQAAESALQKKQAAKEKDASKLASIVQEIGEKEARMEELDHPESGLALELQSAHTKLTKATAAKDKAQEELRRCQQTLGEYEKTIEETMEKLEKLKEERAQKEEKRGDFELRADDLRKQEKASEASCRALLKAHPWMVTEQSKFGEAGSKYDFGDVRKMDKQKNQLAKTQAEYEERGKRINQKVLTEYEHYNSEYEKLVAKREIVLRDKAQIEATIAQLEERKVAAIEQTHQKVNSDFGAIFNTLLPSAGCKLVPVTEGKIQDGVTIQVSFGAREESSLGELSGGQKALIALSLVLSLLKFKPAPIYILDEVDAALDPSHTQNVGRMIKEHFQQSQFLIVSHKEGMFDNANVLYRTKIDDTTGHSSVVRTTPAGSSAASEPAKAKAVAGKGKTAQKDRAALGALNAV